MKLIQRLFAAVALTASRRLRECRHPRDRRRQPCAVDPAGHRVGTAERADGRADQPDAEPIHAAAEHLQLDDGQQRARHAAERRRRPGGAPLPPGRRRRRSGSSAAASQASASLQATINRYKRRSRRCRRPGSRAGRPRRTPYRSRVNSLATQRRLARPRTRPTRKGPPISRT